MDTPIQKLPEEIKNLFIQTASFLYMELEEAKLEVIIKEAPKSKHSNHKIRITQNNNPQWYRDLYTQIVQNYKPKHSVFGRKNPKFRDGRGCGKIRPRMLSALKRIIEVKDKITSHKTDKCLRYEYWIRDLIKNMLTEGYSYMGQEIPPNKKVSGYFTGKYKEIDRCKEEPPF